MNHSKFIEFAKLIGELKKVKRAGWVRENVKSPESVAEHSFRTIVLAMTLASQLKVNQEKLIKMAIIHDLGETAIGDLVDERGKKTDLSMRETKEEKEKEVIAEIFEKVEQKNEYLNLFTEMVERKTEEAKLFWEIDKLERTLQAFEYEKEQKLNLEEFFENADAQIKHPTLKSAIENLKKLR